MPAGIQPGAEVICSACSTKHLIGQDPDAIAQNQSLPKENWQPGVREFMEKMQARVGVPPWAFMCKCPSCKKVFGREGVRGLSLCLNAQNFGDIVVEGHCQDPNCSVKSEHYFRKACQTVKHFAATLRQMRVIQELDHPAEYADLERVVLKPTAFIDIPAGANNVTEAMANSKLRGQCHIAVVLDDSAFQKTEPAS